jgi:hypothetical protein
LAEAGADVAFTYVHSQDKAEEVARLESVRGGHRLRTAANEEGAEQGQRPVVIDAER